MLFSMIRKDGVRFQIGAARVTSRGGEDLTSTLVVGSDQRDSIPL
jgi:hypothetical protein